MICLPIHTSSPELNVFQWSVVGCLNFYIKMYLFDFGSDKPDIPVIQTISFQTISWNLTMSIFTPFGNLKLQNFAC